MISWNVARSNDVLEAVIVQDFVGGSWGASCFICDENTDILGWYIELPVCSLTCPSDPITREWKDMLATALGIRRGILVAV